jgi:hypothetical protein
MDDQHSITPQALRDYLARKEGLRLEFKLKCELTGQNNEERNNELAKDIIALLNTAGRHANDYAYLIIGAGDKLRSDGKRDYEPLQRDQYQASQFLDIVNARCLPKVSSIYYEEIEIDGNLYGVVILPPSPYVHALIQSLKLPGRHFAGEGVVLHRRGEAVAPAIGEELLLMSKQKEAWREARSITSEDHNRITLSQKPASAEAAHIKDLSATLGGATPPTMRFITDAQKCISVFISHSNEDNSEAKHYETIFDDAGFSAFQYGYDSDPRKTIPSFLVDKILKCHFFVLIISERSLASRSVQREVGLAVALQKQNRSYKPIIIPLYSKNANWRWSGRPSTFPTRDFESGRKSEPFDLTARGLEKYASAGAELDDAVISFMKPCLLVTRLNFQDEATFYDTEVFRLYEDLFPPEERDDPDDIVRCALRGDLGTEKSVLLPDNTCITYRLDSRWFILTLANQAIGLGFSTFDHASRLLYGNYIAVQRCWRGGDVARAFGREILKVSECLFPDYVGTVFEVEPFDRVRVRKIIDDLKLDKTEFSDEARTEVRKFLRVCLYQGLGCLFFLDKDLGEPLIATSPSLDPRRQRDWEDLQMDWWIMWYNRPGTPLDIGGAKTLWSKAIRCIYIEILAKSLVETAPEIGADYWRYANTLIDHTLIRSQDKQITFGKFLRGDSLFREWVSLGIEIAI